MTVETFNPPKSAELELAPVSILLRSLSEDIYAKALIIRRNGLEDTERGRLISELASMIEHHIETVRPDLIPHLDNYHFSLMFELVVNNNYLTTAQLGQYALGGSIPHHDVDPIAGHVQDIARMNHKLKHKP